METAFFSLGRWFKSPIKNQTLTNFMSTNSAFFVSSTNFYVPHHTKDTSNTNSIFEITSLVFLFPVLRSNIKESDKSNYLHFNWCWLLTCRKNRKDVFLTIFNSVLRFVCGYLKKYFIPYHLKFNFLKEIQSIILWLMARSKLSCKQPIIYG